MSEKHIKIEGIKVGPGSPPYIIAELSGNHNGDINRAKKLIDVAKNAGADAVKLQTYTADSLTINSDKQEFVLKEGTWAGRNLYKLYEEAHTPWHWFSELFAYARKIGITIFSSPFDEKAVRLLEEINCPAYKIASNELTDWPLLEAVVKTRKPIILSTGAGTKDQVLKTVKFIRSIGCTDLVVLHCVSAYPALARDTHLKTMLDIGDSFDTLYGLSDHTLGTAVAITAVAMGACVIEKHYTLDRDDGGPDSSFSLEPKELETLCMDAKQAWESIGGIKYGGDTDLSKKGIFTRQLWSIVDINVGDTLCWKNIRSIRAPVNSGGISPMHYKQVLGKKSRINITQHSPIKLNIEI